MAGSAMTKVESQMTKIENFANQAVNDARDALSTLAELDFQMDNDTYFTYRETHTYTPVPVSLPGAVAVGVAPGISAIAIPVKVTKPDIDTVTLGSLLDVTLPNVPTVTFPSLNIDAPVYTLTQPQEWSFGVSQNILIKDDPMIQAAIDRLTNNIRYGGTGLTPEIEAAIWARGLEREEQQVEDSTDKVTSMWAKKGFSLPDGMLAHALSEIQKEYMNRKIDLAREISIKQAELEQVNIFKSLEMSVSLAEKLIGMLIAYEELVFKGQEATARFANEYIDLQIKSYMSMVEAYKATAQVHEMLIRGEIAKVELYKAQLDGQRLIGEINQQTVQIYSERLKATTVLIERYKTEVQAMISELEVEKSKIESNKIQMDAWAKKADVEIAKYNGQVEMYKATSAFNVSAAEILAKQYEVNMRGNIAEAELKMKRYETQDKNNNFKTEVMMAAAKGVAEATAQMAAGAMSAMSAHAGMTYSETQPLKEQ